MRPGKQFEDEAGRALKHLGAYRLNQNEEHGACDWVAFHRGMGLVIECKETRKGIFPISEKPVDSMSDIGYSQLVGRTTKQRNEDTKMKKTICAADLTASNYDEARAILGQMETVVDWTFNQGLFTVEYSTDDQEAIEKDWREALASLPE